MGQVPDKLPAKLNASQHLLIGTGKLATHIAAYYDLLGLPLARFDRALGPTQFSHITHILIAVPDRAIAPLISDLPGVDGKTLVHFSGLLHIPGAWSAHPLMSFRDKTPLSLTRYKEIAFVIEEGGPKFELLLPGLPNKSFTLPSSDKAKYHALCVLAGNFSTVLWQKLLSELEGFKIPHKAAVPYLRAVTRGLEGSDWNIPIGPLARKDFETLEKDASALEGDPFQEVFRALRKAAP